MPFCRLPRKRGGIVTAEAATVVGALGGAVAETVIQTIRSRSRSRFWGVPEFARTGAAGFVLDRFGTFPGGIAEAARALI